MRFTSIIRRAAGVACLICLAGSVAGAASPGQAESFFRVDELTPQVVLHGNQFYIPAYFGPTGMVGWVLDEHLVVREVEPGSPAAGAVQPNDVLFEAGGKPLGAEALKTLGLAVGEAEKNGQLRLGLMRAGRRMQVTLKLPVLGAYAEDWPRGCDKSSKVLQGACRYLAKIQNADGSFDSRTWVGYAMNGMALLASEDPRYIENARRIAYYYAKHNNLDATGGTVVWGWGYMGIFLAEYYLKTGDQAVLDLMEKVARTLAKSQQLSGTWGHGPNPGRGYVQGGSLNAAAGAAWIALLLIKECGVDVDPTALAKATAFFSKYTDRGTIPYGNHRPEFALTGNSKDALASIGFAVMGDDQSAQVFARLVTDGYRSRCKGHTGGFLGFTVGNIAGLSNPHRPDYRRMLDYWAWLLDVSRSYDGGFLFPHTIIDSIYTYRGPVLGTGAIALVYAAPSKPLRIMGAPKSVFAARDLLLPTLTEAVSLYRRYELDDALDKVKGTGSRAKGGGPLARQFCRAAETRKRDVDLSLAKAARAIEAGDPALAVTILTNLDRMCGGKEPRIAEPLAEARSARYEGVFKAQEVYEKYKWLTSVWPEAREAFEKLADSPEAGVFGRLAREELTRPADSHKWSHYCESLYARCGNWRADDRSKWTMVRTAGLKGGNWPRLVAAKELREAGALRDDFVQQWRGLVLASGLPETSKKPSWRYLGLPTEASLPADGWAAAGFDDSSWTQGPGPLTQARGAPLTVGRGATRQYMRIAFTADKTDFTACRLYYKNPRRRAQAVVYLNGRPVAWLDEASPEYDTVELTDGARELLRKGANVLAVRSSGTVFDIGLYAQEKGGRP